MNELRAIDRIDTGPRFSQEDAVWLNERFRDHDTRAMLRELIEEGLVGELATVSSFGAEDFAELLHCFFFAREGRSLVLAAVPDAAPAVAQDVEVLALLVHHLGQNIK